MKTKNTDKLLELDHKNNLVLKNIYSFQLNGRNVKVIFSDNANAQTLEDALVKIATRMSSLKGCNLKGIDL